MDRGTTGNPREGRGRTLGEATERARLRNLGARRIDDAPVSSNSAKPDSTAIVDAHNMFPRALDALNAVLEVLDAGVRDGDDAEIERNIALSEIAEALEEVTM